MRKLLTFVVIFTLAFTMAVPMSFGSGEAAFENEDEGRCTAIYFGKDTTENGSYFIGRSEDISASYRKLFYVNEAQDYNIDPLKYDNYDGDWRNYNGDLYVSGTYASVNSSTGVLSGTFTSKFRWPYPARTLRYTICADSSINEREWPEPYGEVGMNEAGVSVSCTVTLSGAASWATNATTGDPMVSRANGGLDELDTASILLMNAKTAREGVELLGKIIDTVGAAGREGTQISDPNETWFFQILSGRQYVGVKCPPDMVGYSPNATVNVGFSGFGGYNGYLDVTDTENVVASPGLIAKAKAAGRLVGDPADPDPDNPTRIRIVETYSSSTSVNFKTATNRWRSGYGYIYGWTTSAEQQAQAPETSAPNFFIPPKADKKYSLYEALRFLGYRNEGTAWELANPTGNGSSPGNSATVEGHVFELRTDMPADIAQIMWICFAPVEFGVYIPMYANLVTDVIEKGYAPNKSAVDTANLDNNTFYHIMRQQYIECAMTTLAERERIGNGVRAFWERYQKELISQQAVVDDYMKIVLAGQGKERAEEEATRITKAVMTEAYEYAKTIVAELRAFKAASTAGPFVPSLMADPTAVPSYAAMTTNTALAKVYADDTVHYADAVKFNIALAEAKGVNTVAVEFEVDGNMLSSNGATALNGFNVIQEDWTDLGNDLWKCSLILGSFGGYGVDFDAYTDVATLSFDSKALGDTALKVTSFTVIGLDDESVYSYPVAVEVSGAVEIVNKYDLDKDGLVDLIDLGVMLLYVGYNDADADWNNPAKAKAKDKKGVGITAKRCDVNYDGVVDMLDLTELIANFD